MRSPAVLIGSDGPAPPDGAIQVGMPPASVST